MQKKNQFVYGIREPRKGNSKVSSNLSYVALGYQVLKKDPIIRPNFWYVACYKDLRDVKLLTLGSPSKAKVVHLIENYLDSDKYKPIKGVEALKFKIKVSKLSIKGKMKKWPWYPSTLIREESKFYFRNAYRKRILLPCNTHKVTQYTFTYRKVKYLVFSRFDRDTVIKALADEFKLTRRMVRRKIKSGNTVITKDMVVIKPKGKISVSNYNIAYHIIKCERRRIRIIHQALNHL